MSKEGLPGWAKGVSGNPNGRPPIAEAEVLREAIASAMVENGNKHILKHFVERAYKSDFVLIALIKKIVPDLTHVNFDEKGLNINVTIKEIVDGIHNRLRNRVSEAITVTSS